MCLDSLLPDLKGWKMWSKKSYINENLSGKYSKAKIKNPCHKVQSLTLHQSDLYSVGLNGIDIQSKMTEVTSHSCV